MESADGKSYLTDVVDIERLLRLVQLIPSPETEPFNNGPPAQVSAVLRHQY